jgi:subtilase family serine protease
VAIIDAYASPTITSDVNTWSTNRGLPQFKANQFTQVVAPGTYHHPESGGKNKQDPQGWYGEETLDVEAVHGMALANQAAGHPLGFANPPGRPFASGQARLG